MPSPIPPIGRLVSMLAVVAALSAAVPFGISRVEARTVGGVSFGLRGFQPFLLPPGLVRLLPGGAVAPRSGVARPLLPRFPMPSRSRSWFGTGFRPALLGAGVLGLFGRHGFGLLQLALIGGLVVLAFRAARFHMPRAGDTRFDPAGFPSGTGRPPGMAPLRVAPQDFDAFEAALIDVETAYGREDIRALGRLVTPEVLRAFGRDIGQNRSRGLHNHVDDPRLIAGDLAQAWREGPADYATVEMRFSLRDVTVDRVTGLVVAGDPSTLAENTELWTFRRDHGGPWLLSGIQQPC